MATASIHSSAHPPSSPATDSADSGVLLAAGSLSASHSEAVDIPSPARSSSSSSSPSSTRHEVLLDVDELQSYSIDEDVVLEAAATPASGSPASVESKGLLLPPSRARSPTQSLSTGREVHACQGPLAYHSSNAQCHS